MCKLLNMIFSRLYLIICLCLLTVLLLPANSLGSMVLSRSRTSFVAVSACEIISTPCTTSCSVISSWTRSQLLSGDFVRLLANNVCNSFKYHLRVKTANGYAFTTASTARDMLCEKAGTRSHGPNYLIKHLKQLKHYSDMWAEQIATPLSQLCLHRSMLLAGTFIQSFAFFLFVSLTFSFFKGGFYVLSHSSSLER